MAERRDWQPQHDADWHKAEPDSTSGARSCHQVRQQLSQLYQGVSVKINGETLHFRRMTDLVRTPPKNLAEDTSNR